jgi:probable HAF family extracellular repeat protein
MSDLGPLLGGANPIARDVNNQGVIVGTGYIASAPIVRAFVLDHGAVTQLPDLGGDWCDAFAINDSGQIAGACNDATGTQRAVRWDNGTITNLSPDAAATATGINAAGQVSGYTLGFGRPGRAFVWHDGLAIDLGVFPGSNNAQAWAINDLGVVSGVSEGHAVTWNLEPASPPDDTPPVVEPLVTGTLGNEGWYTSDVSVSWSVRDDESTPEFECPASLLTTNTTASGRTFECAATSAGGTTTSRVTIKRDATAPRITFIGSDSYMVDQVVAISCNVTDLESGVATQACESERPAYEYDIGLNHVEGSANDRAGNSTSATFSFSVTVTPASLCALVNRWVTKPGTAHSLCAKLDGGALQTRAFANELRAQSGKAIDPVRAEVLIRLAAALERDRP